MWMSLNDFRRLPAVPGVYIVRHRESGKEYVGQSKNVRKRMVQHRARQSPHYFHRALRQHGLAAFDVCLFLEAPAEQLGDLEIKIIAERGTFAPGGYNASLGGLGPTGVKWSDERRAAQSVARKGIRPTDEARAKMSLSALINNPFRGKRHSAESREKIGKATTRLHTGTKRSDQARANISASLMGRVAPVLSAEARARVSAARRGKPSPGSAQPGARNAMYGKKGGQAPSAKVVGVWRPDALLPLVFDSAGEAATFLGIRPQRLSNWISGYRVAPDGTQVAIL